MCMFIEAPRLLNLNLDPLATLLNITIAIKIAIASLLLIINENKVPFIRLLEARREPHKTSCRNIVNFPRHRLKEASPFI